MTARPQKALAQSQYGRMSVESRTKSRHRSRVSKSKNIPATSPNNATMSSGGGGDGGLRKGDSKLVYDSQRRR